MVNVITTAEIDNVLKKVREGIIVFDDTWEKVCRFFHIVLNASLTRTISFIALFRSPTAIERKI